MTHDTSDLRLFPITLTRNTGMECGTANRVRQLSDVAYLPSVSSASSRSTRMTRWPNRCWRNWRSSTPTGTAHQWQRCRRGCARIRPRSSRRPTAAMLIGLRDGQPVTGGAFRRFDAETAELKRIWTDSRYRRQGYAKALLAELETEIAARGYRRVYLTTGDRQPEAEELYLSLGIPPARRAAARRGRGLSHRVPEDTGAMSEHLHLASHSTATAGIPRRGGSRPTPSPSPAAGTGPTWPSPPNAGCWTS